MNETNMAVVLQMRDQASPQVRAFGQTTTATMADIRRQSQMTVDNMQGMGAQVVANKEAFAELSSGVRYMGTTFLALGVAMQAANNESIKQIGNFVMMAGAVMTVVGSAAGFIDAIGKMVKALRMLRIQQILTQAFAGPAGWITLGVGVAVAGGTIAAVSAMESRNSAKMTPGAAAGPSITVNQNIQGSVVTERQLTDSVQKGLLLKGQRNSTTGVR